MFWKMYYMGRILLLSTIICSAGSSSLTWGSNPSGLEFVWVEGGTFVMQELDPGKNPVGIARNTTLSGFWISRYMVTLREWSEVAEWGNRNGYSFLLFDRSENYPVGANWYGAIRFCNALSEMEGFEPVYYVDPEFDEVYRLGRYDINNKYVKWNANGYRLPTDAEWEFAARGGTKSRGYIFSGNDDLDQVAWYWENSHGSKYGYPSGEGRGIWPVGEKKPNELGIYDMSGNLDEWVWDRYNEIDEEKALDPKGPREGPRRIARGGSYASTSYDLYLARRPVTRPDGVSGIRIVRKESREE